MQGSIVTRCFSLIIVSGSTKARYSKLIQLRVYVNISACSDS